MCGCADYLMCRWNSTEYFIAIESIEHNGKQVWRN